MRLGLELDTDDVTRLKVIEGGGRITEDRLYERIDDPGSSLRMVVAAGFDEDGAFGIWSYTAPFERFEPGLEWILTDVTKRIANGGRLDQNTGQQIARIHSEMDRKFAAAEQERGLFGVVLPEEEGKE